MISMKIINHRLGLSGEALFHRFVLVLKIHRAKGGRKPLWLSEYTNNIFQLLTSRFFTLYLHTRNCQEILKNIAINKRWVELKHFWAVFFYGLLFWFKLLTIHLTAICFFLGEMEKLCIVNGSFLQWKGSKYVYVFKLSQYKNTIILIFSGVGK